MDDKAVEASAARSALLQVIAELREFVQALQERPDIDVQVAQIGDPADEAEVEQVRELHSELADLYAQMNGVHVEWLGKGWDAYGCLRIPNLSTYTVFTGEDDSGMGFGEEYEAMLLDEVTAEGNTWIVRKLDDHDDVRLIFASSGEGEEGVVPAESIAAYLRRAMDNGFCEWWPQCFMKHEYVTYEHFEDAITQFRAGAKAPVAIEKGTRVTFLCFSEGGRGTVVDTRRVPEANTETEYFGTELAEVELDVGSRAWIPFRFLSGLDQPDGYERLREQDLSAGDELGTGNDFVAIESRMCSGIASARSHFAQLDNATSAPSDRLVCARESQ